MKKILAFCCIGGVIFSLEGSQIKSFDKKFYVDQDPTKGVLRADTMNKCYSEMYAEYDTVSKKVYDYEKPIVKGGARRQPPMEYRWRKLEYLINPVAVAEKYDEEQQIKIFRGEIAPPPAKVFTAEELAHLKDENSDYFLLYYQTSSNEAIPEAANLFGFLKKASPDNPEHIKIVNEVVAHLKYARFGTLGAALIKELGEITFEPTVEITELKIPEVKDLKKAMEVFRSLVVQIPHIVPSDYDVLLRFYQRVPRQLSTASVGTEASSSSSSNGKIEINLTKQTTIKTGPGHHGDIHVEDKSSCVIL